MRTPEQMTEDVNNLNCHGSQSTHNPVTVAQMEAIYAEAMSKAAELASEMADTYTANGSHDCAAGAHAAEALIRSYVETRPIDMPDKEESK